MQNWSGKAFAFYRALSFIAMLWSVNVSIFSQLALILAELGPKNLSNQSLLFSICSFFVAVGFLNSCARITFLEKLKPLLLAGA